MHSAYLRAAKVGRLAHVTGYHFMSPIQKQNQDEATQHCLVVEEALAKSLINSKYTSRVLLPLLAKTANKVSINCAGSGPIWIDVVCREDVQLFMTLAKTWTKHSYSSGISYDGVTVDHVELAIRASDEALPPTCKLVKKTRMVPAHEEEYNEVVCDSLSSTQT
jgi:hypothetical protein